MAKKILEVNHRYKEDSDIFRAVLWKVPMSKEFPQGIKYSFCYIHQNKRILGYDNERSKGHHMHIIDFETNEEIEEHIKVDDIEKLFEKFKQQVYELRRKLYKKP